jgi:hypothetical protein
MPQRPNNADTPALELSTSQLVLVCCGLLAVGVLLVVAGILIGKTGIGFPSDEEAFSKAEIEPETPADESADEVPVGGVQMSPRVDLDEDSAPVGSQPANLPEGNDYPAPEPPADEDEPASPQSSPEFEAELTPEAAIESPSQEPEQVLSEADEEAETPAHDIQPLLPEDEAPLEDAGEAEDGQTPMEGAEIELAQGQETPVLEGLSPEMPPPAEDIEAQAEEEVPSEVRVPARPAGERPDQLRPPEPAEPAAETQPEREDAAGKFSVQLAAISTSVPDAEQKAQQFIREHQRLNPESVRFEDGWIRIFVGRYDQRADAEARCRELRQEPGLGGCFVRRRG